MLSLEKTGVYQEFDPTEQASVREQLLFFLEKQRYSLHRTDLRARFTRMIFRLGSGRLVRCAVDLITDKGTFSAVGEGFGAEAAVRNVLISLEHQVEQRLALLGGSRSQESVS